MKEINIYSMLGIDDDQYYEEGSVVSSRKFREEAKKQIPKIGKLDISTGKTESYILTQEGFVKDGKTK